MITYHSDLSLRLYVSIPLSLPPLSPALSLSPSLSLDPRLSLDPPVSLDHTRTKPRFNIVS